jgi:hypothetical protein
MAFPLFWLGAAALSAVVTKELADDRKNQQNQRKRYDFAKTLQHLSKYESVVASYPTEVFSTPYKSPPCLGAIVCCQLAGVLDHTGIWVDDDTIIELGGNGLIKPISTKRFLSERSGSQIFIACDSLGNALGEKKAAEIAISQIYQYQKYDVLENNCHHFVWRCYEPDSKPFATFKILNQRLARYFNRQIYWDVLA